LGMCHIFKLKIRMKGLNYSQEDNCNHNTVTLQFYVVVLWFSVTVWTDLEVYVLSEDHIINLGSIWCWATSLSPAANVPRFTLSSRVWPVHKSIWQLNNECSQFFQKQILPFNHNLSSHCKGLLCDQLRASEPLPRDISSFIFAPLGLWVIYNLIRTSPSKSNQVRVEWRVLGRISPGTDLRQQYKCKYWNVTVVK
jgi:hypothetical protein